MNKHSAEECVFKDKTEISHSENKHTCVIGIEGIRLNSVKSIIKV